MASIRPRPDVPFVPGRSLTRWGSARTGVLVVVLVVAAMIGACGRSSGARTVGIGATRAAEVSDLAAEVGGSGVVAGSTTSTSTTAVAPTSDASATDASATDASATDASAFEDVAVPGSCVTVIFTPPTASTPQAAELCSPAGQVESTAIVLVHGGAGVSGSRTDLSAWQTWYAAHGYLTLPIDYALVDPELDDGIYPLPEQNVKAGVQYLRSVGSASGVESIVVQGHSAGARLAAIVATSGDDPQFDGPELWPGVSDSVDGTVGFYGYYDGTQFNAAAYFGGDGPWTGASAIAQADQVDGWTVLVHGTSDSIVAASASEAYATALRSVGAEVDLVEIEGAEHGLDGYDSAELTAVGQRLASLITRRIADGVAS